MHSKNFFLFFFSLVWQNVFVGNFSFKTSFARFIKNWKKRGFFTQVLSPPTNLGTLQKKGAVWLYPKKGPSPQKTGGELENKRGLNRKGKGPCHFLGETLQPLINFLN